MARATRSELERRLLEVGRLLADCMTLREIRAYVNAKTAWGPSVSDATLKYYMTKSRAQMKAAAAYDYDQELGIAKCRYEHIMARAAAKGDLRMQLLAARQHERLLGLEGRRPETQGVDAEAARTYLCEELAQEMADHEDTDRKAARPGPGARRKTQRRPGDRPRGQLAAAAPATPP